MALVIINNIGTMRKNSFGQLFGKKEHRHDSPASEPQAAQKDQAETVAVLSCPLYLHLLRM